MPNEYESLVLEDEQLADLLLKYKQAAAGIAQIIQSADNDGDGELTTNELAIGLLNLILELAENHDDDDSNDPQIPVYDKGSGTSFTGIKNGKYKLDLTKITNKLKELDYKKSNIGHNHPANSITSGVLDYARVPGFATRNNGDFQITGAIQRYSKDANLEIDGVRDADTGITYWYGLKETQTLDFQISDNSNNLAGSFRTVFDPSGHIYSGPYACNYVNGNFYNNYIYAGVKRGNSGPEYTYTVKDVDAFYKNVQPLPRHMGILAGTHSTSTGSSYSTDSSAISFSSAFGEHGQQFTGVPKIVFGVEVNAEGNQENAEALAGITVTVVDTTKTSFKFRIFNATQKSGISLNIHWMAIGSYSYSS